jgi:hypothetical protein
MHRIAEIDLFAILLKAPRHRIVKCARRFLEEWNIGALSELKSWVQQHTQHRLLSNSFGRIWSPL